MCFALETFHCFSETVYGIIGEAVKNSPAVLVALTDKSIHENFSVFDAGKEGFFDEILRFETYFAVNRFIDFAGMVKIRPDPLCFFENMELSALHTDFAGHFAMDITVINAAQEAFKCPVIYVYQIRIVLHFV